MKTQLRFVICLLFAASTLSATWAQPVATVQLDSVWGCPGQVVEVPLRVFGVSELGINSFQFTFRIDTENLRPVLLSGNPEGTQGFPSITSFNPTLEQRGGFGANFSGRDIMIAWIDRMGGHVPPATLQDGDTLFMLNLELQGTPTVPEPIVIHIATLYHLVDVRGVPYNVSSRNGHVLAKSRPDVRIDRTFFDNPRYTQSATNPLRQSDITLCIDEPFQLKATGAERFEWISLSRSQGGVPPERLYLLMDRTDVYNPVLTMRDTAWLRHVANPPVNTPDGMFLIVYEFEVRGFNSDGCFGTDTVIVWIDRTIRHPLVEQPTHVVIERGETLDLALEFEPAVRSDGFENWWAPQVIRWFPHDKIEDPKQLAYWLPDATRPHPRVMETQTGPIYESTWIWAEIRQLPLHIAEASLDRALNTRQGCVQLLNIRVDIRDEMFRARISAMNPENLEEYDYFCGAPGLTEHHTMLAALIEGGSGQRTYNWSFRPLYDGPQPIFSDITANPTEITFFGTTEVSVTVVDDTTGQEIRIFDTLFVETSRTLSVNIAMDDASQRFFEMGFCQVPEMPLTLLATVDAQDANYQVFWEETRPVHTPDGIVYRTYRVHGMEGAVARFPHARAGAVYRAVVQSQDRCVTQQTVWSNIIDPQSQWFESSQVILDQPHNPGCNTTPAELVFRAVNVGHHALFHIYRNGELIDYFDTIIEDPNPFHTGFTRQVESQNYWDHFSIRFTNQSARCLRHPYVMSEERTLNAYTTRYLSAGNIVSIFGGDEVCDTPDGIFTFRLENMAQFSRGATVIWKINGTEWGRYEFNPNLSDSAGSTAQRPSETVVLNQLLGLDEATSFAQGFPFHLNATGFPQIGPDFVAGDRLTVRVVSREMCGDGAVGGIVYDDVSLTPTFIEKRPAVLTVTPENMAVCKGDNIEFRAELQHMNLNAGLMTWFLNGNRVGEGETFTLGYALNNDKVEVVFESNFACAPNLPLRVTRVVNAQDLPALALRVDSVVCAGETFELLAETDATEFLWTGNLSNLTVKNPTATPLVVNTTHDFAVTVTDERGCQSTATVTVRAAPRDAITANIWLENAADTAVCGDQLIVMNSAFSPNTGANVERVWLRNGIVTHHTDASFATTNRDGDTWQLRIAMPTLNTCLPRVATSGTIAIRVEMPVQARIVAERTTLCPGDSILLSAVGGAHHRWTSDDLTFEHTGESLYVSPTEKTRFFVQTFGQRSLCHSRDSITISVEEYVPVSVALQLDPQHHQNNCARITDNGYLFAVTPTNPGTLPRFDWYINDTHIGFQKGIQLFGRELQPGDEVRVMMTADVVSCRSNVAMSNTVVILETPELPTIEGHKLVCAGETTTLTVQNPQSNVTFRWYSCADGFTQPIPDATTTLSDASVGIYIVVATNQYNCERMLDVEVAEGLSPNARITLLTPRSEVRTREPIRFRNDATGWAAAYWQFGNGNGEIEHHGSVVEHEFTTIQNYLVGLRVVSMDGCEATYSLSLDVQPGMVGIFIPTAFVPGSTDDRNNQLRVFAADENPIVSLRFSVYALDGRQLFTTNDPNNGWDGRYNGREMPTGNYSWMVSARLASGEEVSRSGVAMLVR